MKQLRFEKVNGWGGKRKGAGRPNRSGSPHHMKREWLTERTPAHITIRLRDHTVNLRCDEMREEFENCVRAARKFGLRVNHFSIQSNHLHLIVEAGGNSALAAGMRSFCGRLSRAIRKRAKVKGSVFSGRYHLHVLKTPTEMKNALRYVFFNFAKHAKLINHLDEFTSAHHFAELKKLSRGVGNALLSQQLARWKVRRLPNCLSPPRSWLATKGWLKAV